MRFQHAVEGAQRREALVKATRSTGNAFTNLLLWLKVKITGRLFGDP
jgi:hypothetical protein